MAPDPRLTGWIDQFERADEDPLAAPWAYSGLSGTGDMVLEGGNATHQIGDITGDYYWTTQAFSGPVIEVWGQAEGGQAAGIAWALDLYQSPGSGAVDGYRARQEVAGVSFTIRLYRVDNGSTTAIATTSDPTGFVGGGGNTFLFYRLIAATNTHEVWYTTPALWPDWTMVIQHVDATYTGSFYIGMGIRDDSDAQVLSWEGIGGGVAHRRTQIYRWIKN